MTGIGFFAPLPLALMIPFMAYQSLAMGEAFGQGYQYGKRRISSLTNEEFNKLEFKTLSQQVQSDISAGIPAMKSQMSNFATLQSDVIKELLSYVKQFPSDVAQGLFGGASGVGNPAGIPALVNPQGIEALYAMWQQMSILGLDVTDILKKIAEYEQNIKNQAKLGVTDPQLDTSGQSLAAFEAAKAKQAKLLAEAKIRNQQQIASTAKAREEQAKKVARAVSVVAPTSTKRKAGQSQIIERNRLLSLLSSKGKQITQTKAHIRNIQNGMTNRNPHRTSADIQRMKASIKQLEEFLAKYLRELRQWEQEMAVLITRYQF